jgi:hypothetical protein
MPFPVYFDTPSISANSFTTGPLTNAAGVFLNGQTYFCNQLSAINNVVNTPDPANHPQYVGLQGNSSGLGRFSRTETAANGNYALRTTWLKRPNGGGNQNIAIRVNGTLIQTTAFASFNNATWVSVDSPNFTISGGSVAMQFDATINSGDDTLMLYSIDLIAAAAAAPTLGAVTNLTNTSCTIALTDNSTTETGFRVYASTAGSGGPFTALTPDYAANASSVAVTGLIGSESYHFIARSLVGSVESANSNVIGPFITAATFNGGGGTVDIPLGSSTVTGVTVSPTTATVAAGSTTAFSATVQGANVPSQSVTWSAPVGGSVIGSNFIAPNAIGSAFKMRATSIQDAGFFAEATITVTDGVAPTGSLSVTPNPLTTAGTLTLTATVADNVAIQSVAFFEGVSPTGTLLFTDSAAPYIHNVAKTSANNGTNNFYVEVRDTSNNLATFTASAVVNIAAVGITVTTSALRISEWSGGSRIEKVRLMNGASPVVGAVINCSSEDPTNVSTSAAAATDSNGYAAFLLSFNSGGRSLLTFTHAASGSIAYLMAISRTLADS